ncbi:MAG TPA: MMPL family transporter [Actinomycetes bacterium]|nr:MMPL family transporter [Actinomycetes bacterium]
MLTKLARTVVRRRGLVALAWLVVALAGLGLSGPVFDRLGQTEGLRPDAESVRAQARIDRLLPGGPVIVAVVDGRFAYDPSLAASVTRATEDLARTAGVTDVDSIYTSPGGQVAPDNRSSLMLVELAEGLDEARLHALQDTVVARLHRIDAPRVLVGGKELAEREFAEQAVHDLARGEVLALAVLLVVLLVVFGGVVAAALPLIVAVASISGTLLVLLPVGLVTPVSEYSVNVVTLLGLGLAVDYSLLVLARFREERAAGHEPAGAVELAVASAGRTVVYSALVVALALAALLVFAEPLLRSMALPGAAVVLLGALAAVTLLPALLALWGRRVAAARPPRPAARRLLPRLAAFAQRRAAQVAPLVALALVTAALPFAHANLADAGPESLPRGSPSRQVDQLARERFGRGVDPVSVLVDVDDSEPAFVELANRVNQLPGVRLLENRPDVPGGHAIIDVTPDSRASAGPEARRLVSEIRALDTPFAKQVAGTAAEVVDYRASVAARLPFALGLIVLVTFLLLFQLTGSLVVPVKALVMNLLSLGASLGALVWIFQDGHLSGPLGFDPVGAIDLTTPLLLLVLTFGLSMDYEVFLLARIKEAWDRTGDNAGAIEVGLQRSGPVVTAAATCIVVVFVGFAAGALLPLKALGVGMTIAVLLDVTVVRGLLLPATMQLLGDRNWWAPAPLRRVHGRLLRRGSAPAQAPRPPAAPDPGVRAG